MSIVAIGKTNDVCVKLVVHVPPAGLLLSELLDLLARTESAREGAVGWSTVQATDKTARDSETRVTLRDMKSPDVVSTVLPPSERGRKTRRPFVIFV
jgi:hypothetical protein